MRVRSYRPFAIQKIVSWQQDGGASKVSTLASEQVLSVQGSPLIYVSLFLNSKALFVSEFRTRLKTKSSSVILGLCSSQWDFLLETRKVLINILSLLLNCYFEHFQWDLMCNLLVNQKLNKALLGASVLTVINIGHVINH